MTTSATSDTSAYTKPLPLVTPNIKPFHDAAKAHELRLPKCRDCSFTFYPPELYCPRCLSKDLDWPRLSGKGTVWSFILMHQRFFPSFVEDIPYNVAYVKLDDAPGVLLCTNIVEADNDALCCDMAVEAVFEDVTNEVTLVKFRPAK